MRTWASHSRARRIATALALFAAAFLALTPRGYMVQPADGLRVTIALCGGATALVDLDDHGQTSDDEGLGDKPYAFAAAPMLAAPEIGAALAAPQTAHLGSFNAASSRSAHFLPTGPPLPPRGPPLPA